MSMRGSDLAYPSPALGERRDSGTSDHWRSDGSAENCGLECGLHAPADPVSGIVSLGRSQLGTHNLIDCLSG
jgi:hypothetical protein